MIEIIPAVLSPEKQDFAYVAKELAGLAHTIQLDVCDGKFAGMPTWPYSASTSYPSRGELSELAAGLLVEVDLMVKDPASVVDGWAKAGASRLIVHAESADNLQSVIDAVLDTGVECGVALGISTPLSILEPVIDSLDLVQLMGIRTIGWQGEPFDGSVVSHVRKLRAHSPSLTISVDGGVSREHVRELVVGGVNRLVIGSAIVKAPDMKKVFIDIQKIANG